MICHGRILYNDINLSVYLNDIGSYDTRDSKIWSFTTVPSPGDSNDDLLNAHTCFFGLFSLIGEP